MNGAVNLTVAHPLEAQALLDWFGLAEIEPGGEFRCFADNRGIALLITGMGVENAAAGVGYLHGLQPPAVRAWLNIGIAGHPRAALGEGLLIHRIEYRRTGACHWPPVPALGLPSCGLITVDEPETVYPEDAAYDMEAAGFYAAASGLIATDLVQVYKIVSDNRDNPASEVEPKRVPELFRKQETAIRKLVDHSRERSAALANWRGLPPEYQSLLRKYRFSVARRAALARTCRRFRALGKQQRLTELAHGRFRDAAALMAALDAELARAVEPGGASR